MRLWTRSGFGERARSVQTSLVRYPIFIEWSGRRSWRRARARPPGAWSWRFKRKHIDDTAHAVFAVCKTEVGITARLAKCVLINGPCVGKNDGVAIGIIRGTKLPVHYARRAAGNAVPAAHPSPSHCVPRHDGE